MKNIVNSPTITNLLKNNPSLNIRAVRVGQANMIHSIQRLNSSRAEHDRYTTEEDKQLMNQIYLLHWMPGARLSMNHDHSDMRLMLSMLRKTVEKQTTQQANLTKAFLPMSLQRVSHTSLQQRLRQQHMPLTARQLTALNILTHLQYVYNDLQTQPYPTIIHKYSNIRQYNNKQMQSFGGLFCPLCLDYFVKPITTKCGHSFCQYCIDEYLLHFPGCPTCDQDIRNEKYYPVIALSECIHQFVIKNDPESIDQLEGRLEHFQQWKNNKSVSSYSVGSKIDVRDQGYIWRQGIIIRIISRVGEVQKYIKVQYKSLLGKTEEDLKVTSDRLANPGFYTDRPDIPKQRKDLTQQKQHRIINAPIASD